MAFRTKRRKPRVVWLPVFGRDLANIPEANNSGAGIGGVLSVPADQTLVTDIQALTFDYSDSASAEQGTDFRSLQDLTSGNNYRLRRIVGKFFAGAVPGANTDTVTTQIDLAAGFMVLRTDDDGNPYIQAANIDGAGPLGQDGQEDPWIWRRRWILNTFPTGFPFPTTTAAFNWQQGLGNFPSTTAGYGSVADGPHIDQKTARVIGRQERLFFFVQARAIDGSGATEDANVNWSLDYRLLASLRPAGYGNRRNASR